MRPPKNLKRARRFRKPRVAILVSRRVKHDLVPLILFAVRAGNRHQRARGKKALRPVVEVRRWAKRKRYLGNAFVGGRHMRLQLGDRCFQAGIERYKHRGWRGMPEFIKWDATEDALFLIAHEVGHLCGFRGGRAGEIQCELFAADVVRAWRECPR